MPVGPVNLAVVHATLVKGKLSGYRLALGALIVEVAYCAISLFGLHILSEQKALVESMQWISIPVLLTLGLMSLFKKDFLIIGTAHNQLEYYFKKRQNCKIIALYPIFYNPKFSKNKTLGPIKFNLISQFWNSNLCALGGINETNIKKINITKVSTIAYQRYIAK